MADYSRTDAVWPTHAMEQFVRELIAFTGAAIVYTLIATPKVVENLYHLTPKLVRPTEPDFVLRSRMARSSVYSMFSGILVANRFEVPYNLLAGLPSAVLVFAATWHIQKRIYERDMSPQPGQWEVKVEGE